MSNPAPLLPILQICCCTVDGQLWRRDRLDGHTHGLAYLLCPPSLALTAKNAIVSPPASASFHCPLRSAEAQFNAPIKAVTAQSNALPFLHCPTAEYCSPKARDAMQ